MTSSTHRDAGKTSAAAKPVARGTGVSLWRQIAERIERDIYGGVHGPGSQLPSEAEIADRFGVNRHTVRRALAVLAERGLLRTTQGLGSFVEEAPLRYPIGRRVRFSEIVSAGGRQPRGRVVGLATVTEAEPARRLGLAARAPLIRVELLSMANGVPLSLSTSWFPQARLPGFETQMVRTGSVTRALAACGIDDYVRVETLISARTADPAEQSLLQIPAGRVVLVVDAVNADPAGAPIQAQHSRFSADRVQIAVGV